MTTYRVISSQIIENPWTVEADTAEDAVARVRDLIEEGEIDVREGALNDLGIEHGDLTYTVREVNAPVTTSDVQLVISKRVLLDLLSLKEELHDHGVVEDVLENYDDSFEQIKNLLGFGDAEVVGRAVEFGTPVVRTLVNGRVRTYNE